LFDRLSEIDQGAIVDNKRLSQVLQMAQLVQANRDNRRSQSTPSTNAVARKRGQIPGKKKSLELDQTDLLQALQVMKEQRPDRGQQRSRGKEVLQQRTPKTGHFNLARKRTFEVSLDKSMG
jgi:hypothetical protein